MNQLPSTNLHVLMLSVDTSILKPTIGNARHRHEYYAEQVGQLSMVICNRASGARLALYQSARVTAVPTNSRSYAHYLVDAYRQARALAAQQPVDVITSQDPFLTALIGLSVRRALQRPLIMQDHSSFLSSPYFRTERLRNRLLYQLARWTLPRADAVRVVNHAEREVCISLGVPPQQVCVIPMASALEAFAQPDPQGAQTWRAKLGISVETPIILWVGRPVAFKNLPLLVEAFAQVHSQRPQARLVLVGNMTDTGIPDLIQRMGLADAVILPGAVAHADLPAVYQAATLYALPSNYEGLAMVLLEASTAGLPIVSTDIQAAREVIGHEQSGLLVPIGDAAQLAQGIIRLLDDAPLRDRLSRAAAADVRQRYDERRLLDQWVAMWRHVAKEEPPCAS